MYLGGISVLIHSNEKAPSLAYLIIIETESQKKLYLVRNS